VIRRAILAIAAVAAWIQPAAAQQKRPMTLIDLMEVPRVLDPQLAPDGRSIVYQLNRADWKAGRRIGHLWRQAIAGGDPVQLTFGDSGETTPRWAPDGKSVLFLARRAGDADTQIYLLPANGGEPRALTHHASSVVAPAWAPDGSAIYFAASDPRTAQERQRDRIRDDVYAFEENVPQRHLWKVIVSTGAEVRITSGDFSVLGYRLSRDGRAIVFHRAPTPLNDDAHRSEVWVADADGEHARSLTSNDVEETDAELSPDGRSLLFLAEANGRLEPNYASTLFVMSASGGAPTLVLPDVRYAIERATWSADGRSILAVANMGVHSEVVQIDVAARTAHALTDGAHSIPAAPAPVWSYTPAAGRMVFQFDEPTRYGDVWTLSDAGGAPARVTAVYDNLDRDFQLPRVEKVEWKGSDGATIEGLLWYPLEYAAGTRAPLVVQMHGGPSESDKYTFAGNVWDSYVQVLTAKGYFVLKPNYRGSAGYGNDFLRDVNGGYFRQMHLDVLAGVDALIARGLVDGDRMAVMGWSAGGHLTNKLIAFTNRFKAASSGAGASDWTSLYTESDIRWQRTPWFGGAPWQADAQRAYWNASPLKDAAAVRTPTLFIVGENDGRVPLAQSVAMYRALKSNGVDTHLYVAPREGHQLGELRHQLYKMNVELEWFERHVTKRPYTWETAPGESAPKGTLP